LSPAELDEAKSIIDHALAVAPNSPAPHFARGVFFYWGFRQYENALDEFNRALELQPNNALARQFCGWVYRRRGEWERSLADAQRAQELDPRDPGIPASLGGVYTGLRLWKDAERTELQALSLDPHSIVAATILAMTRLNSTGDINSARQAFANLPDNTPLRTLTYQGDIAAILGMRTYLHVMERNFANALLALEKEVDSSDPGRLRQLAGRAALRLLEGKPEAAKSAGEEARPLLESRVRERPDDTSAMTELCWVYLTLGRNADALRLARQAADSMPIEKDSLTGASFQNGLAQIEARTGVPEEAVKRLRHLLSIPAGQPVSIARLKVDPVWDPIRNRPDFQQLLSGPEQIGPNK